MKQYLVIGLGRFGRSVAKTLYESNQEVMAVDVSEDLVQDMINDYKVENAMVLDGTDLTSLQEIGAQNFDRSFYPIFKSVSYAGAESSVFGRFLLLL